MHFFIILHKISNIISHILTFTQMVPIFEVALLIVFQVFFLAQFLAQAIHHCYVPSFNFASHFVAGSTYPSFGALQILLRGMKPHPQIFPHCFRIFRDLLVVDGNQFLAIPEGKNFP